MTADLVPPLGVPDRRRRALIVLALMASSAAAAVIVARITFGIDGWLWNLDLPKIHYPLALFYHEALAAGRLPVWEPNMGLGYPLYAEGQIGAFYPPHWLTFQLEPLPALDLLRLVHLTLAGTGAGLLALRVSGSRYGALLAALIAVMGGAIVSKLEWWNVVAAYGWMPWVLLPLAGARPVSRRNVAVAGILWGIQALAGHPNTWLMTGLAAVVLLLGSPWLVNVGRAAAFGLIGVGIGAIQVLPTAILRAVSTRADGLSAIDVFTNTSTPFDFVSVGFVNLFLRSSGEGWDYATSWFPDGHFPLLEATLYVGLPVLGIAGLAIPARRARRWLILAGVMILAGVIPAFRPDFWTELPIVNGLRAPVRSYMVLGLAIAVLAAIGISRLGRTRSGVTWSMVAMAIPVTGYVLLTMAVAFVPGLFDALVSFAATDIDARTLAQSRERALAALTSPWPLVAELALGLATAIVVSRPRSRTTVSAAVILAAAPLALFMPMVNPARDVTAFSYADLPIVTTLSAENPHRVLTYERPAWYGGMPNQLAAADVPDIEMFSSLELAHVDDALRALRRDDPRGELRNALGIDVVVTFGEHCGGDLVAHVEDDDAYVCRAPVAAPPPYWVPGSAVSLVPSVDDAPPAAMLDLAAVRTDAVPLAVESNTSLGFALDVNASQSGWVFIDRAWWSAWEVTVDGARTSVSEAHGGQVFEVAAGHHRVVGTLTMEDARLGGFAGLLTLMGVGIWLAWPRLRDRMRRHH